MHNAAFARPFFAAALVLGMLGMLATAPATAQKKYGPGVSDTEIKIGTIGPYTGPAAVYGLIGKTMGLCFDKINAEAASTAARSPSSKPMIPSTRRRPWSKPAAWSRKTRCWLSSAPSARFRTLPSATT